MRGDQDSSGIIASANTDADARLFSAPLIPARNTVRNQRARTPSTCFLASSCSNTITKITNSTLARLTDPNHPNPKRYHIMPPKSRIYQLAPPPEGYVPPPPKPASTTPKQASKSTSSKLGSSATAQEVLEDVVSKYVKNTPQRVKLLDTFMAFLVVVGALQFVYCCIVGNFVSPFASSITPMFSLLFPAYPIGPSFAPQWFLEAVHATLSLHGQTADNTCSHSTPSSPASAPPSANSSSQPRFASRPIPRTRPNSGPSPTNARLRTTFSAPYYCISSV
jgi:hypothetical protein